MGFTLNGITVTGGVTFQAAAAGPTATPGGLWTWGMNQFESGNLGLGNKTYYSSPKQVGALTTWLQASASGYHGAAVRSDGTLWTWGRNNAGQLGLGNTTYYSSPKQVGALTTWSVIGPGYVHLLATSS